MRKLFILFIFTISNFGICFGQDIPSAPEGKAVVYFVRTSSLGFAINFTYIDSATLIGRFNGPKYIRYECEPGTHLFWARSENRDFIEAEVETGKIYFIEATPKMGALKAGVSLTPIDPADKKTMDKVFKLMNKKSSESFTKEELEADAKELEEVIAKGLEKYSEEKAQGKVNIRLEKTMNYTKP
jgi:hypothetical protein